MLKSKLFDNSLQLVGTLSSNSDYISPVIDEQRATVYVMCNRINDKSDANGVDDSVSRNDRWIKRLVR